eukprot:14766870-Heterocapsa_arctica.AAC.1
MAGRRNVGPGGAPIVAAQQLELALAAHAVDDPGLAHVDVDVERHVLGLENFEPDASVRFRRNSI